MIPHFQEIEKQLVGQGLQKHEVTALIQAMNRAHFTEEQMVRAANQLSSSGTQEITAGAVRELGLRDSGDPDIFARARAANAVILTKDSDVVDLVARLGPTPKIIWLTCGNTSNATLQSILLHACRRGSPPRALT